MHVYFEKMCSSSSSDEIHAVGLKILQKFLFMVRRLLAYHHWIRQLILAARQVAARGDVHRSRPERVRRLCIAVQT